MRLRPARRVAGLERTLIRRIFDAAPPDAINLGLGQPDLATPPALSLAGIDALARGATGYTTTAGLAELRAAIGAAHPGGPVEPSRVLVTCGSQEALAVACLTLIDPGDEVLCPDPGYPAYPTLVELVGGRARRYRLREEAGFRARAEEIEPLLGARTRLVILGAPANPTGACHRRAELEALLELLRERGVAWISDEVYAGFAYDAPHLSPAELDGEGGVVVSALSKALCMTGWRVGWLVAPPDVMERAVAVHQHLVTCAPTPSQHAGLAAFDERGRRARTQLLERFRRRRALALDELGRAGLRHAPPDGAFYVFVDVAAGGPSLDVCRRLLERRRVITIPGIAFGPAGEGWLRLSYAAPEAAIVAGIRALGEELAEAQSETRLLG